MASTERRCHYGGGPRNLPWRPEFAPQGRPIHISPGEGIYVPILAPHWVKTHGEVSVSVSVSLSLTWRSVWSFHQEDAHRLNRSLRKFGLDPAPPRPFPHSNLAKSVVHRAARKAEQALERLTPSRR